MYGIIIGLIALVLVLSTSIALYFQQDKLRIDMNARLTSIVDQVNDSQFYEYKFDKQQDQNIQNNDKNLTNLYNAINDAQKNVKFMELTSISKEEVDKSLKTNSLTTNIINLGDKYQLSGLDNDEWISLRDKLGKDYYGGLAVKNLWSRDNAWLNGNTTLNNLNVSGTSTLKGGKNQQNQPTQFGNIDGNNYIRGNTIIDGTLQINGTLKVCDINGQKCRNV